jgi:two-component system, chemotaxis family, sensor kinase CheA
MGDSERARDDFFSEAQEIVEGLGRDLLALDDAQRAGRVDPDLINDVFRAVHTLKGLAGLFGANRMSTLSHELEGLLDSLRLGRVELNARVLAVLFRAVELYGSLLQMEKDGRDQPMPEIDELIRELSRGAGQAAAPSPIGQYELDPGLLAVLTEYEEHRLRTNIAQGLRLFRLRVQFQLATIDQALDDLKATAKPHGEIITYLPTGAGADADSIELDILMASRISGADLGRALAGTGVELEEVARTGGATPEGEPRAALLPNATPPAAPSMATGDGGAMVKTGKGRDLPEKGGDIPSLRSVAQTVRVDIQKLDRLMNIVGELAIVGTALSRLVERTRATQGDRELPAVLHRLHRTFARHLDGMQKGILEVRMVPLGQVFDKLARVVRQISREADKQVNLVITGAETEVDKLIVEELSDPLMHMMRNAIDHGIESRSEREAVGKPAIGTIALNAFQKGNHVVIEIEDDGRGIDTDKLLEAGIRRGAVHSEDVRTTSRREILNLVFLPGITTKSDVSEMSGRGVGMDVVKTNISKVGGVIDLVSELGIGTKVTVTLPITLAIISALIIRVADRLYAIPLSNVQEAVLLDGTGVRRVDGREVITLRGATLQICFLSQLFDLDDPPRPSLARGEPGPAAKPSPVPARGESGSIPPLASKPPGPIGSPYAEPGPSSAPPREPARASKPALGTGRKYIVVTAVGTRRLGLVVDSLLGEQDVVIKALGPSLKGVRGFAGATELGDQRIGLVIDTPALIEELAGSDRARRPETKGAHG